MQAPTLLGKGLGMIFSKLCGKCSFADELRSNSNASGVGRKKVTKEALRGQDA
jgi:hypothetical protein